MSMKEKASQGKEHANGYNHTYFDSGSANFANLSVFPTKDEMNRIAEAAHTEAKELFSMLDIDPYQLVQSGIDIDSTAAINQHISLWAPEMEDLEENGNTDDSKNDVPDKVEKSLFDMLYEEEQQSTVTRKYKTDEALKNLTFATTALMLNDTLAM